MKDTIGSVNKIKSLLSALRKQFKAAAPPQGMEPLDVLTLAILRRNCTLGEATEGLRRLHEEFVDFNEMRVAPPKDIVDLLQRNMADVRMKAEQLTQTLNRVYDHGNELDLKHLAEMGKRELKEHLRGSLLLDEFGEAYLMSHLFDAPVVPMDDRLAGKLKEEGYFAPDASATRMREVLEEAIPGRSRPEAFELLSQYAAEPAAAAKAKRKKPAEESQAAPARKAAKADKAAKAKPAAKRPDAKKKKS